MIIRPSEGRADEIIVYEILRLLWLLHFASTDQLCRLIFDTRTVHFRMRISRLLGRLVDDDKIWHQPLQAVSGNRGHINGKASGGLFYGLTVHGKHMIKEHYPELQASHCTPREGYLSEAARRTMLHSSNYTEFCTRFVTETRFHPLTIGLFLNTECTSLGSHLRMDGLLRYRFWRQAPFATQELDRYSWHVPWMSALTLPTAPGMVDRTYAIEIDQSTEEHRVITRKAENYKRTFLGGMDLVDERGHPRWTPVDWYKILCPGGERLPPQQRMTYWPVPVFIVPTMQRLVNVWEAWHRGWPNTEIRVTDWERLDAAQSILNAPYLNQHRQWVNLIGKPMSYHTKLPEATC